MDNEETEGELEASAGGKTFGVSWAIRAAGTWAPTAVLAGLMFVLLLAGDEQRPATSLALSLSKILLGVSFGVAFMSKRVEDWKAIADERKREIDRMADAKNDLADLKRRKSSAPERKPR